MPVSFLDPNRPEQESLFLFSITRVAIVTSAVNERIIEDDDLATVPEILPHHIRIAEVMRDDLYQHHASIKKPLQFPLIASCFGYAFAKGAEAAALWHESPSGKIDLSYRFADALRGVAGANVNSQFSDHITAGMKASYNVFVDFQNRILVDERHGFANDGRKLADVIACGFLWSTQVGLDYGMAKLDYP